MSRKKASDSGGGKFKRLLGWTVLMAIVFSAGLITGERLVRKQSLGPLVSVTDQVAQPPEQHGGTEEGAEAKTETTFAFFDQLTRKDDVALSSTRKTEEKPAKEAAPAQKEANKKEAKKPAAKEAPPKAPAADDAPAPQKAPEEEAVPQENGPEAKAPAEASPSEDNAARYTLQVAAHPDMDSAKSHMERLRKMGLEPHLISAAIPGKGKFYRVRVGKFGSMDEARSFQASLKRKNSLSTFVSPL